MGIKNWILNRKLKKDRQENPQLYANLENFSIKHGELDFEPIDSEKCSKKMDRTIKRLERKIERIK